MARKKLDITNWVFGQLTAIRPSDKREGRSIRWKCRCNCGGIVYRSHHSLKAGGDHASCGCLLPQIRKEQKRNPIRHIDETNTANLKSTTCRDNPGSVHGVCFISERNMWQAEISFKHKQYYLGLFSSKEEAVAILKSADQILYQPVKRQGNQEHRIVTTALTAAFNHASVIKPTGKGFIDFFLSID